MGVLGTQKVETPEQRNARRLIEKKYGRTLIKLKLISEKYSPEYILSRIMDAEIPLDHVAKETPDLYDFVKGEIKKKEKPKEEKKEEEKPKKGRPKKTKSEE